MAAERTRGMNGGASFCLRVADRPGEQRCENPESNSRRSRTTLSSEAKDKKGRRHQVDETRRARSLTNKSLSRDISRTALRLGRNQFREELFERNNNWNRYRSISFTATHQLQVLVRNEFTRLGQNGPVTPKRTLLLQIFRTKILFYRFYLFLLLYFACVVK